MGEFVTGPGAAKVYIKRPFRARIPAMLWYTRPLPVSEDEPAGDDLFWQLGGTRAKTVQGKRAVRRAVDLWNEKAGEQVFKVTPDRGEADVIAKPIQKSWNGRSWGEMPHAGPEQIGIMPEDVGDASTIAHELGHTQGLKHLNMNPTPGVMRYGLEGGGAHRRQPTEREGQKVVHKQNTKQTVGKAEASAAAFNQAAAKQKKPKKPAHERKVTGGHKVMQ